MHNLWCEKDPDLKVGDVTFGWLYHAQKSCDALAKPVIYKNIDTPCLFALAQNEYLVDNNKARKLCQNLEKCALLEIENSCHEILMDCDNVRDVFMDNFFKLVKENILDKPETLKPF